MQLFSSHIVRLRTKTETRLDEYNRPSFGFFFLTGLSAGIAALGLVLDNVSIVIGAMLVAPMITPIFGFSLGLIVFRFNRMFLSLLSLLFGTAIVIGIAALTGGIAYFVEPSLFGVTGEIVARAEPNLLFFLVALFSGMAGAYAYTRPNVLASVTGVAISVAVIPPLAVAGLGFVLQNWTLVEQSFLLYVLNLAGIFFGSIVVFLSFGFGKEIEQT